MTREREREERGEGPELRGCTVLPLMTRERREEKTLN
jgi:hypothetical protein